MKYIVDDYKVPRNLELQLLFLPIWVVTPFVSCRITFILLFDSYLICCKTIPIKNLPKPFMDQILFFIVIRDIT